MITFTNTMMHNSDPALPLEDVFTQYAAFGGVLDQMYNSLLDEDFADLSGWTVESGSWSVSGNVLTGTGAADYDIMWWDTETPSSFVLDLEVHEDTDMQGIIFRGTNADNCYMLRLETNLVEFAKYSSGSRTVLSNFTPLENAIGEGEGTLRLMVMETSFSGYDYDRWIFMAIWKNDRLLLVAADNIAAIEAGLKFGLAVGNGDTFKLTGARIPDLTDLTPTATLDPDEAPMGGIQRAVLDRVIAVFGRHDGSIRAFRNIPSSVQQDFGPDGTLSIDGNIDLRELANYIRLYYALDWVEVFDTDSINTIGMRFRELTNNVIETKPEAIQEAEAIMRRMKENSETITFSHIRGGLLLEPNDRITAPNDVDYLVSSISLRYDRNTLVVNVEGRLYAW